MNAPRCVNAPTDWQSQMMRLIGKKNKQTRDTLAKSNFSSDNPPSQMKKSRSDMNGWKKNLLGDDVLAVALKECECSEAKS